MKQRDEFSYSILSYVHTPGIGESINIGVFVCCPAKQFADARFDAHFEYMARVFRDFKIEQVRFAIHDFRDRLRKHLRRFKEQLANPTFFTPQEMKSAGVRPLFDAADFLAQIWSDGGLSFQYGEVRYGITSNVESELDELFDLFVGQQRLRTSTRPVVRKTEVDIWNEFQHLLPRPARTLIRSHFISTPQIDVTFNYTYKNGRYTAYQPLTVDYRDAEQAQMRAARWLGIGHALKNYPDLSKLYFLLGSPKEGSAEQKKTFIKVQNLLNQIPIRKEFVREEELGNLAVNTVNYMKQNGDLTGLLQ